MAANFQGTEPKIRVEFHYQIAEGRTVSLHLADCGLQTCVGLLKNDLQCLFGDRFSQVWTYQTMILEDGKTLEFYEIDHRLSRNTRIFVKNQQV